MPVRRLLQPMIHTSLVAATLHQPYINIIHSLHSLPPHPPQHTPHQHSPLYHP